MKKIAFLILTIAISFSCFSQLPDFKATVCDSTLTGYYFLGNPFGGLLILDNMGNLVYYNPSTSAYNLTLQANGVMTFTKRNKFYFMDSTFHVFDSITCKGNMETDKHDMRVLPNGHYLLMGTEIEKTDLSHYYFKGSHASANAKVSWQVIQELDSTREVVFEWHSKNHLSFNDLDTFFLKKSNMNFVDLTHANAIEMDDDGNILFSLRNFDEIIKINHITGEIIWRLGGPQNQFKFVNCPVPFYGQHDIRRIKNGHITLLDNGENTRSHGARAMEFELDEIHKIAKLIWSYTFDSTMYSEGSGNVQRLNNSHTLVCFGITPDSLGFVVIDSLGRRLFQLNNFVPYRAFWYPSLPWQIKRPEVSRFDSAGVTYLKAASGYGGYIWNNDDRGQIIKITISGWYFVAALTKNGTYLCSEKIKITL